MLLHFAGAAAAAHAQVLHSAAETGDLVALEMAQHDDDVRVIQGPADIRLLAVNAVGHRHDHIVRALQAVGDDIMAAGGHIVEAVDICVQQMVHGVFPGSGIERIAVREEGLSAQFLYQVRHGLHIVRPDIGEVPQFPEMQLDRHELSFKIDAAQTGLPTEFLQLDALAYVRFRPEIGKVDLCFFHRCCPPLFYELILCHRIFSIPTLYGVSPSFS